MLKHLKIFKIISLLFFLSLNWTLSAQSDRQKKIDEFDRLRILSRQYQTIDFDSSKIYADSAYWAALNTNENYFLSRAMQMRSRNYFYENKIDSAVIFGNRAIELMQGYRDSLDFFIAEYNMGNLFLFKDDYIHALLQFKKVIRIIDQNVETYMQVDPVKVSLNRAYCLYSIGIIYDKLGAYKDAVESFKKSEKITYKYETWESEELRAVVLGNMGLSYFHLGEYEIAESYAIAGMEQKKKIGREASIGYNYQVLAQCAYGREKYELCIRYLEMSDEKFQASHNQTEMDRNRLWKGKSEYRQGNFSEAFSTIEGLEQVYREKMSQKEQTEFYDFKSELHQTLGDYKIANEYLWLSNKLKDSVMLGYGQKMVREFLTIYEEEENDINHRIELLKSKQEREKLELEIELSNEKEILVYSIFGVSTVCLILIILIVTNAYRKNKKTNQQLSHSIEEKQILFKEVHHRVKNNFQIISSLLSLQQGKEDNEAARKVLKDAQGRIRSMSLVHEMLYKKNEAKEITFDHYVYELTSVILDSFRKGKNDIELTIESDEILFDLEMSVPLGLILNEIITNSVKHAFQGVEKPEIKISLRKQEAGVYRMIIEDNGVGMTQDQINESRDSLGMELIQILSEQLNGSCKITGEKGTKYEMEFTFQG